jgi:hypothetical protein
MPNAEKLESKGADKTKNPEKLEEKTALKSISKVDNYIQKAFKNGSWAYKPGDSACIEPTAYCGIARRKDEVARKQVIEFFCANQNNDGGWSTSPGVGKSDWTSGLALLALRVLLKEDGGVDAAHAAVIDKAVSHLFEARTEFYGALAKTLLLISKGDAGLNYPRGWPWSPGCFHWVEPTAYTLLALKIPEPVQKQDSKRVIERANNFLLEHACEAGGWNHGNDLCLNVHLPPYVVTSAEALIALSDQRSADAVQKALKNLSNTIGFAGSAMSTAWTTIAQVSYGIDASNSIKMLIERQNEDGSFGPNLMVTALSMLALQAYLGDNVLKI